MMALPLSLVSLTLDFHYLLSQWPGLTVARFIISSLAWIINFNRLKRDPFRIRPDWPRSAIYLTRVCCNAETMMFFLRSMMMAGAGNWMGQLLLPRATGLTCFHQIT